MSFVLGDKHIPFTTDSLDDLSFPTELEYNGSFYQLATVNRDSLTGFYRQIEIKPLIYFAVKHNLKRACKLIETKK